MKKLFKLMEIILIILFSYLDKLIIIKEVVIKIIIIYKDFIKKK